ncbi:PIH1 domain-containing protein 1-like [Mytilus trossulus]|uniref:PIH1 domain-containing protein 1-like n=1 Tax=Mytilus trossulus TaxID=6551 RepID=UPI00300764B9
MLNPEMTDEDAANAFLSKLMLDTNKEEGDTSPSYGGVPYVTVVPSPGFCVKTKNDSGQKIFINVCHCDNVPQPRDITEDDLLKLLDSDDPFSFRVPMSLGEPHAETDKSGSGCTVYDIVVHTQFLEKMKTSEVFKAFFLSVSMEGIEDKFKTTIDRKWIILKNRKSIGTLQEHNVRKQSKPVIMDMDEYGSPHGSMGNPLIQEVEKKPPTKEELRARGEEPLFRIIQEPPVGHPEFLVAEINLPKVKLTSSLELDIGEDRIFLQTRSNVYYLDIYLPYNLIQEECGAQFNKKTRILTMTMPVQPLS